MFCHRKSGNIDEGQAQTTTSVHKSFSLCNFMRISFLLLPRSLLRARLFYFAISLPPFDGCNSLFCDTFDASFVLILTILLAT